MEPKLDIFFASFGICVGILLPGIPILVRQVVEHSCCLFHALVQLSVSLVRILYLKPASFTSGPEAKSTIFELRERIGNDVLEYGCYVFIFGNLDWPEVSAKTR